MAFLGVLILSLAGMMVMMMIIIFVICVILFVFIPALILSITNLVLGVKHHWPKHNIVLLSVFGSVVALFLIIGILTAISMATKGTTYAIICGTASESVEAIKLLLTTLI